MKYDAVVFDLFGTLVENFSRERNVKMLTQMARALDAPQGLFVESWLGSVHERWTGVFDSVETNISYVCAPIGIVPKKEQIAEATRIRYEFTRASLTPRHDAVDVLEKLRAAGHKTALLSDCSIEVPTFWAHTPFAPLFDTTIFSCKAAMRKPDPRLYKMVCDHLAVPPERCLYVGDGGSRELTGAAAAGMEPVLIRAPEAQDAIRVDEDTWEGTRVGGLTGVLALVD